MAHLEIWPVPFCSTLKGECVEVGVVWTADIDSEALRTTFTDDDTDDRLLSGRDVLK